MGHLVGDDKTSISIPIQTIVAISPLMRTMLSEICFCDNVCSSIYIPWASTSSLKILKEILTTGESSTIARLNETIHVMKDIQCTLQKLGIRVNIGPKLSLSSVDQSTFTVDSSRKSVVNSKKLKESWTFKEKRDEKEVCADSVKSKKKIQRVNRRLLFDENDNFDSAYSSGDNQNFLNDTMGMDYSSVDTIICSPDIALESQEDKDFHEVTDKLQCPSNLPLEVVQKDGVNCNFCSCVFSSKRTLDRHIINDVCLISCPLCKIQNKSPTIKKNPFHRDNVNSNDPSSDQLSGTDYSDPLGGDYNADVYTESDLQIKVTVQCGVEFIRDLNDDEEEEDLREPNSSVPGIVDDCDPKKPPSKVGNDLDSYEVTIRSMMSKVNGNWHCKVCWKEYKPKYKTALKRHIECNHTKGFEFACPTCDKKLFSKASYKYHNSKYHKVSG